MTRPLITAVVCALWLFASSVADAQTQEVICDTLDICKKNDSKSYVTYNARRNIAEGHRLCVFTARYTDFNSVVSGKGDLYMYSGGERTYLGEHNNKTYPNWVAFKGSMHVLPYKKVDASCGFYGVVMNHNGKSFSPENIDDCLASGKVNTLLQDNQVVIHNGATIASENGSRACRFGELQMETGSKLYGYYKSNSDAAAFYLIGHLGTNGLLAGQILPSSSSGSAVGLIKEGEDTYRITGTGNNINAGIRILQGQMLINSTCTVSDIFAFKSGLLGGTGSVNGNVEVYGTVNPGDESTGRLRASALTLHPKSRLTFEITDTANFDRLVISKAIERSNMCENFTQSADVPVIKVKLTPTHDIHVGDEFKVLTAKSKGVVDGNDWQFDVVLPTKYTWAVEETTTATGYSMVLRVVSLDDDPANADNDDDDDDPSGDSPDEEGTETYGADGDGHFIRYYADQLDKKVGVAVSTWNQTLSDDTQSAVKAIYNNFNMIVAENEMKFENTEPLRGQFSFGAADEIVNFAQKHNMTVRGHTLAWHSQCPQWLSADGKKNDKNWTRKELLQILKNHIENMVGHYKGKVAEWDVVNECLDDDQSIIRTNPDGYKLRAASVWTVAIGEDFIDSAFVWAHRADPDARLYLNDYDVEFLGKAKTQALYNLAKRLKDSGIPIDGVGLQCHFDVGNVDSLALNNNIARYADIGLNCILTEVDLGTSSPTNQNLQRQARNYHALTNIMLNNPNCPCMVIWGLSDNISWRTNSNPLLFASGLVKKPAYYAVRDALRQRVATGILGVYDQHNGLCPDYGQLWPYSGDNNAWHRSVYNNVWNVTTSFSNRIVVKDGKKFLLKR